jgi:hypothetical protein
MKILIPCILMFLTLTACQTQQNDNPQGIEHVIVIGVDGLSPDGIRKAQTPVMDSMIAHGSVKWKVRTVLTSASSQNWASMIMGAGPEQHGIIDNGWELDDHKLPPIVQEADGRFPTIFSVLHAAQPQAEIGTVYHWKGFGRLFQKDALNYDRNFGSEDSTTADFIQYIKAKKPKLGFVHLDHVDHAGHHDGHGSPEYYKSVAKTDSLVGQILAGIKEAGIEDKTLVIIWADHGGIGYGHGGPTPQEAEIAGIFYGKNVKKGYAIEQQVYTYDLAATIAFALGVTPPYAWTGRPVKAAFEGYSEPKNLWVGKRMIAAPIIFPEQELYKQAGGLYIDQLPKVNIKTVEPSSVSRYTLDGTEPDSNSTVYNQPFEVTETSVVKAKSFDKEGNISTTATAYYRLVKSGQGHGLSTSFYPGGNNWKQLPSYYILKKSNSWVSQEINTKIDQITPLLSNDQKGFALLYEGFIQIDFPGKYTFYTASDDGSKLYINGKEVVNNDGNHGVTEKSGSIELTEGKHAIRVEYYNNDGGFWLDAFYKAPGLAKQLIPADKLYLRK